VDSKSAKEGSIPSGRATGMCRRAANLPCKQVLRERYPTSPPRWLVRGGGPTWYVGLGGFDSRNQLQARLVFNGSMAGFQPAGTGPSPVARSTLQVWPTGEARACQVRQAGSTPATCSGSVRFQER
jgi:hypothetical protein